MYLDRIENNSKITSNFVLEQYLQQRYRWCLVLLVTYLGIRVFLWVCYYQCGVYRFARHDSTPGAVAMRLSFCAACREVPPRMERSFLGVTAGYSGSRCMSLRHLHL